MFRYLVAITSLSFATSLAAEPQVLSGDAIKETIAGAVVEVDTPVGVKFPIHYLEDGRITGEARELSYILGAKTDTGRWWIASDRLCHKWTKWFDGAVQCLHLKQKGSRIFWRRDDGETGTAVISMPSRLAARASTVSTPLGVHESAKADSPSASHAEATALPRAVQQEVARPDAQPVLGSVGIGPVLKRESVQVNRAEEKSPASKPAGSARGADARVKTSSFEPERRSVPAHPVQSFRVWGVAVDDVLNVRDGPSVDHAATGAIQPDAVGVRIVGRCVAEWCPIHHRGIRGWVNSFYLVEDAR